MTSGTLTSGVWTGAETFTETCGSDSDGAEGPDDACGGFGTFTLTDGACGGFGTFTATVGACGVSGSGGLTVGACGRFGAGVDEGGPPSVPSG